MKFILYFCFIFSVQTINPGTLKLVLKTAFSPNSDGELLDNERQNSSSTSRRSNDISYSKVMYNFLNMSYHCGSDKAKAMTSELLATVEAISQLPFMEYFIADTTKINLINAIKKCGNTLNNNTRLRKKQKRPKIKARAKKVDTFFTGAIEKSIASEVEERKLTSENKKDKDAKSNNSIKDNIITILDEVIEGDRKSDEEKKRKIVKVILDIGDNLKSELIKNRKLRETILGDSADGVLSLSNIAFRTNTNPSTLEEDKSEAEHDGADAATSDNETGDVRRELDDDIVLNNNMEIFVKMNKADGR